MNIKTLVQPKIASKSDTTQPSRWKLETPEYLLLLVTLFVIWIVGFLELFTHTSQRPTIFGLYSRGFFIMVVAHGIILVLISALFTRPSRTEWLVSVIAFVQDRWWLACLSLTALVGLVWASYTLQDIERFPGLHLSLVTLSIFLALVLTFAGWGKQAIIHRWRKIVLSLLIVAVIIEIALQGLAYAGNLPTIQPIANHFVAYSRVYQNSEGFEFNKTNANGWYYPEFELNPDTKKLLLVGDTYLQALQVKPTENLGVVLESKLKETSSSEPEVIVLGYPGFGPGLYADVPLLEAFEPYFVTPDDVIVFFNLAYDFQTTTAPSRQHLYFEVSEQGEVEIHPDNWQTRHDLQHHILDGFAPMHVLNMVTSYYLTAQITRQFVIPSLPDNAPPVEVDALGFPGIQTFVHYDGGTVGEHIPVGQVGFVTAPVDNNFVFALDDPKRAEEAMLIAADQLSRLQQFAKDRNAPFRIVTIPVFPAAFYNTYQDTDWRSVIDGYDLFLPEERLRAFAAENNIDFLAMGHYMAADNLSVADIKSLYYRAGQGHLTPLGHSYFADAVYHCFFENEPPEACGQ